LELEVNYGVKSFIVFALATNWDGVLLAVVTGLIILCTMISLILKEMFRRR